uniref:Uncharacterized protein n=1 Tax=Mola mola TaxID=94237 RepID=A0A3Q4BLH6_MOLML
MEDDHVHCMSCFNQRCMRRPQPGVSCDLISCSLVCGAVFHSCKAKEHHLICPFVRVPCLNSGYGCPATLYRNQMYAHLEVCPAGLVCCTMEWNRWPISCLDYTSYESLSCGVEEVEQLDMALALQDQRTLLESLKVNAMAPTVQSAPLSPVRKESREQIVSGINGLNEEHFSKLYEATVETARSLVAALEIVSSANCVESSSNCLRQKNGSSNDDLQNGLEDKTPKAAKDLDKCVMEEQSGFFSCLRGNVTLKETDHEILNTANGPLSGVMETNVVQDDTNVLLSQEPVTPPMASPVYVRQSVAQRAGHVVLEERGLVSLENHWPGQKHYNHVVFSDECSLRNGRMGFIRDRPLCKIHPEKKNKSVDTSDLEQDDNPMGMGETDLISAALLFCLEESRECRRISDTVYVNEYRVDFGTQTFTFPAAILVTNTRVGEMASASACDHAAPQLNYPSPFRTLRLGLVLEALEVEAVPHNRYLPANPRYQQMFPFVCGQSFRRDQFSSHFTNVHGDIHAGLNGWMEHRCPLAYYGCTFSQRRFYPSTRGAKLVHDRHLRSFGVQLCPSIKPTSDFQSDQFSGLPFEILWHIARYLDSFSLCQLSLVSRTMRELCASLLQTRGIVDLEWERRRCHGTPGAGSWQIKNKVWRFSTAFSPVLSWHFTDLPSMSNHLKKCHFNTVEHKTEPVPLPAMCTARDGHSLRGVLRHINT